MTKIAFISDIHSNLPAIESAIDSIRDRGVTQIYCLGDIVGYHSFPNEVIDILKENNIVSIMGNHDLAIINEGFDRNNPLDHVLWWNFDHLTPSNIEYLKKLPRNLTIKIEDIRIKLVHGSPDSINEYIRKDSPTIGRFIERMDTDVLVCGHTHIPYVSRGCGKILANSGSIGKPKHGSPESSYLICTINKDVAEFEINYSNYNIERMTQSLLDNNFDKKYIESLITGTP